MCPGPSQRPSQGRAVQGGPSASPSPPGTHLQDEEEEEIGVGHFLELLKEVDRQEGDDVVLGRLDAVALGMERARRGFTKCQGLPRSRFGRSSLDPWFLPLL